MMQPTPSLSPDQAAPALTALLDGLTGVPAAAHLVHAYNAEYMSGLAAICRSMWPKPHMANAADVLDWIDRFAQTMTTAAAMHQPRTWGTDDTAPPTVDMTAVDLLGSGWTFKRVYSVAGDVRKGGSVQQINRGSALSIISASLQRSDRTVTREDDGAVIITSTDTGHQQLLTTESAPEPEHSIPVDVAAHLLWHDSRGGGYEPGSFIRSLLLAWSHADDENAARLATVFPDYAAAFALYQEPDGYQKLLAIVEAASGE